MQMVIADLCVLGAGISGVAAALEAARLGRKVVIVDGAPALGGQERRVRCHALGDAPWEERGPLAHGIARIQGTARSLTIVSTS